MAVKTDRSDLGHVPTLILAAFAGITIAWLSGAHIEKLPHDLAIFSVRLLILLFALSLHEYAHAKVAYWLGDSTAKDAGRMTVNPVVHFDLVGLVMVPILLASLGAPLMLGWAAPVPVNFDNLRRPRLGMFLVAAAGPAMSLGVAAVLSVFLRLCGINGTTSLLASTAWVFVMTNIFIGLFNLLPLYPMDGGRMVATLFPARIFAWLRRNEARAALVAVLLLIGGPWVLRAFDHSMAVLDPIGEGATNIMTFVTGVPHFDWYQPTWDWMHGDEP